LPGKTRLRNDLLCVDWDVKHYTLTHSLIYAVQNIVESTVKRETVQMTKTVLMFC